MRSARGWTPGAGPEPELAYYTPPTDTKNTNVRTRFTTCRGKPMLGCACCSVTRRRHMTVSAWGCDRCASRRQKNGSANLAMSGAQTADATDATAWAGHKARFTPASTSYGTQVTISIADYPADVAAYYGQYRWLSAGIDNAASVGLNILSGDEFVRARARLTAGSILLPLSHSIAYWTRHTAHSGGLVAGGSRNVHDDCAIRALSVAGDSSQEHGRLWYAGFGCALSPAG